jgi:uncharacterized protein (DUF2249 family)
MKINNDTKLSHIFRENTDAIDAITSINDHFKKLKNPVLRKVLAPRVTIKDAAKIGNISTREILQKLAAIGFQVTYDEETTSEPELDSNRPVEGITNIVTLDVRPTIAAGADPFKEIMGAVKMLDDKDTLEIINVFEPIPLIGILKGKGYKTWTDKIGNDEYHTYFTKISSFTHQEIVAEMPIAEGSFDEKLASFGGNLKEIDVRLLEMPEPMVTILSELETLADDHVLLVNHKKIPQFLLPELKSRNYQIMSKDIEPGLVLLIIYKD